MPLPGPGDRGQGRRPAGSGRLPAGYQPAAQPLRAPSRQSRRPGPAGRYGPGVPVRPGAQHHRLRPAPSGSAGPGPQPTETAGGGYPPAQPPGVPPQPLSPPGQALPGRRPGQGQDQQPAAGRPTGLRSISGSAASAGRVGYRPADRLALADLPGRCRRFQPAVRRTEKVSQALRRRGRRGHPAPPDRSGLRRPSRGYPRQRAPAGLAPGLCPGLALRGRQQLDHAALGAVRIPPGRRNTEAAAGHALSARGLPMVPGAPRSAEGTDPLVWISRL